MPESTAGGDDALRRYEPGLMLAAAHRKP